MRITPVPHGLDGVGVSTGHRSPGLHMSAIYNDLYQDLEPKRFIRGSLPDPLRLEAGLSFENMLEEGIRQRLGGERPPEQVTEEGIAYSPDLLFFDDTKGLVLGEIKLTWMSSRDVPRDGADSFPPRFEKYFTQMKAYCYHLGTVHAKLFVFFVNGDYRPPKPELLLWEIEFTQRELDENWQMLLNHARHKNMFIRSEYHYAPRSATARAPDSDGTGTQRGDART